MLFIDEAYYLSRPENKHDYGVEAVEVLLQVMETEREQAGRDPGRIPGADGEFFALKPGMGSRVAHHIDFPDYGTAS